MIQHFCLKQSINSFIFIYKTKFRFYWLNCKLQETPEVTETSYMNPVSIIVTFKMNHFRNLSFKV
jgi:hypothetical protein